ncbi:MAG TPA: sugar phosphate isomerase/epimerase [Armatimonadota bacterium]|jgi:sugar phosphate isomerase/epimerase
MAVISRREFVGRAAACSGLVGLLAAGASELEAAPVGPLGLPIGCQVWPLRDMLGDFPAFVKKLAGIGVTRLELCSPLGYGGEFASLSKGKEVRKILADHGMKAESSHFTLGELRGDQQRSLAWAKEIGIKQVIVASLADGNGGDSPTLDQVKKAADEYNRIAAVSAKAGLQQGLHNEGFEMSRVDGKRTYDLLLDLLDPKLVKFQFQMSTITAGFVAADYFRRYPGRFYSMHLQDIDMGSSSPEGRRPGPRQVALGKGSIDWKKTFLAAKVGGVKNYFVEQDWNLTQQSVAFLKTLRV